MTQQFRRFPQDYPWNRVDNLICGDPDKTLSEGTKYRRLNFRIIPDRFVEITEEKEYVKRFKKLLDYISKQVEKDVDIKIETSYEAKPVDEESSKKDQQIYMGIEGLKRFPMQLKRGKRDKYEWMEIFIDSQFNTSKTYRVMFLWLSASASKVDAQIQLMQRRCSQYGLRLVSFPQLSITNDIFIHPVSVILLFSMI